MESISYTPITKDVYLKCLKDFDCLFDVILFFPVPSRAPDLVTVRSFSSTSLVVKWSRLSKNHFQGEPISYQIVYYPANAEVERISMNANYTTNTKTLINLTVYTMYVIKVSAVSSGGIGPAKTARARTDAEGKYV